jgi:hypothetical protein
MPGVQVRPVSDILLDGRSQCGEFILYRTTGGIERMDTFPPLTTVPASTPPVLPNEAFRALLISHHTPAHTGRLSDRQSGRAGRA